MTPQNSLPITPEKPLQRLRVFYASSVLALRLSAVMNLVLVATVLALVFTVVQMRAQIRQWKPLVIRVDQAANAVPVDLTVDNDPATELEAKVFAGQYIGLIQSYDPNTINRDMQLALSNTDPACSRALVNYFNADPVVAKLKEEKHIVQCRVNAVRTLHTGSNSSAWELLVDYTVTDLTTGEHRDWYATLSAKLASRSYTNPFGLIVTGVRISTTVK